MAKRSAGILLYRLRSGRVEVLLVHPGGPFWARKDLGVWSIPKGECEDSDEAVTAARREFAEELGCELPAGEFVALGDVRLASGKTVTAWAVEGDLVVTAIRSNDFSMEWPPRSGQTQSFPEVDRAEWFDPDTAKQKINVGQVPLVDRLLEQLVGRYDPAPPGLAQPQLF